MLSLLRSIISIPSTSDNLAACREVLEIIRDSISSWYIGENNNKPYLIVRNYDFEGNQADIILNGHIDVVPASEDGQFEPIEQDGKLYARGSGDMKWWIVVITEVMKQLIQANYRDKKVILMLTSDEEIGGFDGVSYLVKQGYTATLVLIPDGWALTEVVTGEKWILTIKTTTLGKEWHSSRPWLCDNALERMYSFYQQLKTVIEEDKKMIAPDYRSGTVQLTKVSAGKADNMIPGEAHATINIRHTEKFSYAELMNLITTTAQDYDTSVEVGMYWALLHSDQNNPITKSYLDHASSLLWETVSAQVEHGASDGRFFAEVWSLVLLHRPTCQNIHAKNERVSLSDLEKLKDIYYGFIINR